MTLKEKLQGAPKGVQKAFKTLEKFVHSFDKSGKYKWDEELPAKIEGDKKLEEAYSVLQNYLYPSDKMLATSCDETNPNDPHYVDRGLGWYGADCIWHWYM